MDTQDDCFGDAQCRITTLKPSFSASPFQYTRLIFEDSTYGVFAQIPQLS